MNLDPYLTQLTINSKWISNLKVRLETKKKKTRKKPLHSDLGNNFFYTTPKAQTTKATINK